MKHNKYIFLLILLINIIYPECPDGLIEDECGECWQSYCYCLSDHIPNFDISQNECEENGCWWIGPGGTYEPGDYEFCLFDPYWNTSCTGCTDPIADNYDPQASIASDDNCNEEIGDCCEYELDNNNVKLLNNLMIKNIYPNPFNVLTKIAIDIPYNDYATIHIYDISGRLITKLYDDYMMQGTYEFVWDANNYSTGIYIVNITLNHKTDSHFIHLIK